jgi:ATP-dependent DNA helicase RecG
LDLNTPICELYKKGKIPKTTQKLIDAGIESFNDLLWTYPLRIQPYPKYASFNCIKDGEIFKGEATVVSRRSSPAYGFKAKGRVQLFNITLIVRDKLGQDLTTLKWFNAYPNIRKSLDEIKEIKFIGPATFSKGQLSINNPKILNDTQESNDTSYLIDYPTINGVSGKYLKKLMDKIPMEIWDSISDPLPEDILNKNNLIALKDCFKSIHGKIDKRNWSKEILNQAKNRLIYHEFFHDQLKILTRKKFLKKKKSAILKINHSKLANLYEKFPYELTGDQKKSIIDIMQDFELGSPMMRMIQGDVGCGKTTVAIIATYIALSNNKQVAMMCPTETLSRQHYQNFTDVFESFDDISTKLLLGNHKANEKKEIYKDLKNGKINLLIGTHSLFQDKVTFNNLGLAIIDEQHKFGVEQRLKLLQKGDNPHCIIMTATPIPRSLRLTQYGDLDISLIKELPKGRKPTHTRIVNNSNYDKFLSFLKTRISLDEQVYIVAPAIEESESLDIQNVVSITEKFKKIFPELDIRFVHGKLSSDEKNKVINDFKARKFQVLVSTSVIEVGIDIPNSTVMAIYNPERFGLSSLHQLRGRVGRGGKPGFCFLVSEKPLSADSRARLEVMEKTSDGFIIAEQDLKFRGEGDVFGIMQSGLHSNKRFANIFMHHQIFESVLKDITYLKEYHPEYIEENINKLLSDDKITSTI